METQCGWIIVVFSEDNSVEVVPYSWLNKGICAWPKAKQAKKIIEKRINPNKIDFNFYNARQLGHKTYSEYLPTLPNLNFFYPYLIVYLI